MEPSTPSSDVIPEKQLKIWKIFRNVGPDGEEILKTAKLAHSAAYNRGLVVTMTDETYSFVREGDDVCKILKIPELSGVQVEEFVTGTINFAVTVDRQVFSWYWGVPPAPVTGSLTGVQARQIALSEFEGILALSVGGDVHQWGLTQSENWRRAWTWTKIPKEHFGNQEVISIACVELTGVALTSKGMLYQWISGEGGTMPKKVRIAGSVPFKKVTGGSDFIAALTLKGEMRYLKIKHPGLISGGDTTTEWKTIFKDHKIQDMASCTWPGKVFVVELNKDARFVLSSPLPEASHHAPSFTLPSSLSMDELFSQNGDTSYQTISAQVKTRNKASDVLCNLWENKKLADVAFSVEGKVITAHRCILAERSEYFEIMFSREWMEATGGASSAIEVKDTKYDVFEALLFYIYTDLIKFKEDEDENIFELMKLADFYCQVKLHNECEKILINNISEENAFFFARIASSVNASTLEEKAMKFIADYQVLGDNSSPEKKPWRGFMDAFEKMSAALLNQ